MIVAQLQRQIADRDEVLVGLGRQADHEIQLQVLEAGREDHLRRRQDLVVGDRLVDDAAQPIRAGLRRDGDRPLAALAAAGEGSSASGRRAAATRG